MRRVPCRWLLCRFVLFSLLLSILPTLLPGHGVHAQGQQQRGDGSQFWSVQFVRPIKDAWLAQLRSAGLELVSFFPNNGYVVWGDQASLARLDALAASSKVIEWTGPYLPSSRLAPSLHQIASGQHPDEKIAVTVQFYTTKDIGSSLARLRALAGRIHDRPARVLDFTNITLELPAGQLMAVAGWPDVFSIEPWITPTRLDEVQGQLIAGNITRSGKSVVPAGPGYLSWLASKGFPTNPERYPIVDIVDDGLDQGDAQYVLHPDFHMFGSLANPDRVSYIVNCTTDSSGNGIGGHGTINAGIVAGYNNGVGTLYQDAGGYRLGLGISPYGRISATKVFQNSGIWDTLGCGGTDQDVVGASYTSGAAITSNSWGYAVSGAYNTTAQAYDALTRDASPGEPGNQEMLHIFAAGNGGPTMSTISSPGTAKNVLTVGATESVRKNGIPDGCMVAESDSADDVIGFSSRGPTKDRRMKPDIVAPGVHIQGPASLDPAYNGSGVCDTHYPSGQTLYTWSSGTSHAAPAIAGAVSLVYEYYGRVLRPGRTPSPAMLKALLINSARYLHGEGAADTLPSPSQGWGSVDLGTLFEDTSRMLVDQTVRFGESDETYVMNGTVDDPAQPLRISLVWTDAPGPTTGSAHVNDLDLELTIGGDVYKGNVFKGAFSISGGSHDQRNNVENIFLPAGSRGSFSVRVIARNIADDGVPGNADSTDQDFALVISNAELKQVYLPLVQIEN
ncbi:MAG: hypothetical protein KatS3mg057_2775 [Herpetosiphonaceae bacterium]|nr:MAG: hypothetical protein KatS3mg057_2775 [Herpetosiphonaceae bacterium]